MAFTQAWMRKSTRGGDEGLHCVVGCWGRQIQAGDRLVGPLCGWSGIWASSRDTEDPLQVFET